MQYVNYHPDLELARRILAYYPATPRLYLHSFGCQQNVNDGEQLRGVLAGVGFDTADTPDTADLIIFNTCAVREHAEQRVFGNIGALKALKKKNPRLLIAVCGCMVQQPEVVERLRASYPFVDMTFGPNAIDQAPALLLEKLSGGKRLLCQPNQRTDVVEGLPAVRGSSFKAFVPIMYGCDNFCSYCIVPYVRGRERSRRPQDILAEFRALVADGYHEITLLGQNVNSYGKGLEEKLDFSDLLELLCAVPGDYILRFMTSHPKDATHKLIDTIAAHPEHLAPHIHLPVQSGSNRILREMNRHYTREQYLELVEYARQRIPGVTFSSDIIVGFPGETQEDFDETMSLLRQVGYMQLFTFIYSRRGGTRAADLPDPTPYEEKTARIAAIQKQQETLLEPRMQARVGSVQRVLVEGEGRAAGTLSGRMDDNTAVQFTAAALVDGAAQIVGQFAQVRITGARLSMLYGELA